MIPRTPHSFHANESADPAMGPNRVFNARDVRPSRGMLLLAALIFWGVAVIILEGCQ